MEFNNFKTSWNHCFLCSSPLQPPPDPPQLISISSKNCAILFKYLLHSCTDVLLQKSLLNSNSEQVSWLQLCSNCDKVAETIKELHLFLEVVQMKIINHLKSLKLKILASSRLFGTNGRVQEAFRNFEESLEELETRGINCENERRLLELIFALQTFVFDSHGNGTEIPVVYLEKFVGETQKMKGTPPSRKRISKEKPVETPQPEPKATPPSPPPIKLELEEDFPSGLQEDLDNEYFNELPNEVNYLDQPTPPAPPSLETSSKETDLVPEISNKKEHRVSKVRKKKVRRPPKPPVYKKKKSQSCETCSFVTREVFDMEAHLREHETEEKSHTCAECNHSFTTKQYCELHTTLQHADGRARKCDLCEKMVLTKEFREHILSDHGKERIFSCELCDHAYGSYRGLLKHVERHRSTEQGKKFRCELCSFSSEELFSVVSLSRHLLESHEGFSDLLITCEYPNCSKTYVDRNAYRAHKLKHQKKFACEHCDKCYQNRQNLETHVKHVHFGMNKNFKCDLCGAQFHIKYQFENHQNKEHGIGYECEYCEGEEMKEKKRYGSRSRLKHHRLSAHADICRKKEVEYFKCSECPKEYNTRSKLALHQNTHKKTKDFTCELCGFATKTIWLLKYHMRKHDPEQKTKYKCPHCPKSFGRPETLKGHVRTHTDERPYQCDVCGMSFRHHAAFTKHKKRHLKNQNLGQSSRHRVVQLESTPTVGIVEEEEELHDLVPPEYAETKCSNIP